MFAAESDVEAAGLRDDGGKPDASMDPAVATRRATDADVDLCLYAVVELTTA
jgi:hypothetical protein